MSSLKKFMLGGLDIKSNDLIRDQMRASDLRNVTKTINGDIDKRNGYEEVETFANLRDSIYHKTLDQDILIDTNGRFWKPYLGTRIDCTISALLNSGDVIYTEYQSNLYVCASDGKTPVFKYDGGQAYLAGIPAPMKLFDGTSSTIGSPGSGYFYRFFYSHKDLNGNVTHGPYRQLESSTSTDTVTCSSFKTNNPYGGFFSKYMIIPSQTRTVDNSNPGTSNKFQYTSTDYVVGDKILIDTDPFWSSFLTTATVTQSLISKALTITAIGGGFVTIDINDLSDFGFTISAPGPLNIDNRTILRVFISQNESFGYSLAEYGNVDNTANNVAVTVLAWAPGLTLKFEDYYNEDGQKLRPPLCKFLTAYGDQLVFGNIIGVWDQENIFSQYNNNDLAIYSDFGLADNGENNSANSQKIGESFDGEITGLRRCNDLLIVTKDNSIFAMDGILESGGYSLRKIPTNYIGCLSHRSILATEGGIFFNGNDGIYFTDGVNCSKMSQLLDPFFVGKFPFTLAIDSTKTRSAIDSNNRKYLFYMTDNTNHYCLAFDYEFKEWFIWDVLDMSKGMYQKNNKDFYFANSTKTYKFNTGYSDNGSAISAYYKTNWEDLRNPSVDKKFKYVRIWNLNASSSSFNMSIQKNWVDTNLSTVACSIAARGTIQKVMTN